MPNVVVLGAGICGLAVANCLSLPRDVLARPGLGERIAELTRGQDAPAPAGPTRHELLALVA